jgi:hypothetical protein
MRLILIFLALYSSIVYSQEIHKWTDSEGKVHFGERPPVNVTTETITIKQNENENKTEENFTIDENFMIGSWRMESVVSYGTKIPPMTRIFNRSSLSMAGQSEVIKVDGYKIVGNEVHVLASGITLVFTIVDKNTVYEKGPPGSGVTKVFMHRL